jgi:hypothetical protein
MRPFQPAVLVRVAAIIERIDIHAEFRSQPFGETTPNANAVEAHPISAFGEKPHAPSRVKIRLEVLYEIEPFASATRIEDWIRRWPACGYNSVRIFHSIFNTSHFVVKAVISADDCLVVGVVASINVIEVDSVPELVHLQIANETK